MRKKSFGKCTNQVTSDAICICMIRIGKLLIKKSYVRYNFLVNFRCKSLVSELIDVVQLICLAHVLLIKQQENKKKEGRKKNIIRETRIIHVKEFS